MKTMDNITVHITVTKDVLKIYSYPYVTIIIIF